MSKNNLHSFDQSKSYDKQYSYNDIQIVEVDSIDLLHYVNEFRGTVEQQNLSEILPSFVKDLTMDEYQKQQTHNSYIQPKQFKEHNKNILKDKYIFFSDVGNLEKNISYFAFDGVNLHSFIKAKKVTLEYRTNSELYFYGANHFSVLFPIKPHFLIKVPYCIDYNIAKTQLNIRLSTFNKEMKNLYYMSIIYDHGIASAIDISRLEDKKFLHKKGEIKYGKFTKLLPAGKDAPFATSIVEDKFLAGLFFIPIEPESFSILLQKLMKGNNLNHFGIYNKIHEVEDRIICSFSEKLSQVQDNSSIKNNASIDDNYLVLDGKTILKLPIINNKLTDGVSNYKTKDDSYIFRTFVLHQDVKKKFFLKEANDLKIVLKLDQSHIGEMSFTLFGKECQNVILETLSPYGDDSIIYAEVYGQIYLMPFSSTLYDRVFRFLEHSCKLNVTNDYKEILGFFIRNQFDSHLCSYNNPWEDYGISNKANILGQDAENRQCAECDIF